jgi:hypothetical protein
MKQLLPKQTATAQIALRTAHLSSFPEKHRKKKVLPPVW